MNAPTLRPTGAESDASTVETAPDVQTQHQNIHVAAIEGESDEAYAERIEATLRGHGLDPASMVLVGGEPQSSEIGEIITLRLTYTDYTEMLFCAARAMASTGVLFINLPDGPHIFDRKEGETEHFRLWRPHEDDGDSRRLQVELPGCVSLTVDDVCARVTWWVKVGDAMDLMHEDVPHHGDKPAASRMAVLRAAVAIGRAML